MSIRDQLNENPALSGAILVFLLLISLTFTSWWMWPSTEPEREQMAYFYDLNTQELFEAPASELGPIETDSGPYKGMPAGVRANVYSCGPMVKDAVTFIGYLQVPTNRVPAEMVPPGVETSEDSEVNDILIRRVEDDHWYVIGSREGQRLMAELPTRCGSDQQMTYVYPPPR